MACARAKEVQVDEKGHEADFIVIQLFEWYFNRLILVIHASLGVA
jgi:hypothetical protein